MNTKGNPLDELVDALSTLVTFTTVLLVLTAVPGLWWLYGEVF